MEGGQVLCEVEEEHIIIHSPMGTHSFRRPSSLLPQSQ
jgi:hypothetical protein